jgi:twinkle protein
MNTRKLAHLTAAHLSILEGRGLDPDTLVRHGVVSCDRQDGDWIAIPFKVGDKIVNWKYRTISGEKRFYQDADGDKVWWNFNVLLDRSLDHLPLIITEGELDALVAIQCGYARVMSVPDGAPAEEIGSERSTAKYSYVTDSAAAMGFDVAREIILATDGDGPGANLRNDLAIRLGKGRCKWVGYPRECKDINDAFKRHGHKGVTETISRARWCHVDGVYRMSELPPLPDRPALSLGLKGLDDHYKVRTQDFVVLTGIPSHGKSTLLNNIAGRAVQHIGWKVAFASFEQTPQLDHKRALRTFFNKKRVVNQTRAEIERADQWIDENFAFIVPSDDDQVDLKWVLEKSAAAVIQHGCKMLIIDPWNEMDHVRPSDMSLTEYTGYAIKEFKRFARKHDVHEIVAAHPVKQVKDKEGNFQIPTLYDISDSSHWYNKADIGLVIWRGKVGGYVKTILRVAKARYQDVTGVPGDVDLDFDQSTGHYSVGNFVEDEEAA